VTAGPGPGTATLTASLSGHTSSASVEVIAV
jgi:hypothetical protein